MKSLFFLYIVILFWSLVLSDDSDIQTPEEVIEYFQDDNVFTEPLVEQAEVFTEIVDDDSVNVEEFFEAPVDTSNEITSEVEILATLGETPNFGEPIDIITDVHEEIILATLEETPPIFVEPADSVTDVHEIVNNTETEIIEPKINYFGSLKNNIIELLKKANLELSNMFTKVPKKVMLIVSFLSAVALIFTKIR